MPIVQNGNRYILTLTETTPNMDKVVAEKIKIGGNFRGSIGTPLIYLNSLGCLVFAMGMPENVTSGDTIRQSFPKRTFDGGIFSSGDSGPFSIYLYRLHNNIKCIGTRVEHKGYVVRSRWECNFRITDAKKLVRYIDDCEGQLLGEDDIASLMRAKGGLEDILQREIKKIIDIMPDGENAEQFVRGYSARIKEKLLEESKKAFFALGIHADSFDNT